MLSFFFFGGGAGVIFILLLICNFPQKFKFSDSLLHFFPLHLSVRLLARALKYLEAGPLSICLSAEGGNVIVTGAGP